MKDIKLLLDKYEDKVELQINDDRVLLGNKLIGLIAAL